MSLNTFGKLFRFTTWGESHGAAIGCIIDGCPPRIPLSEKDIQKVQVKEELNFEEIIIKEVFIFDE